MQELSIESRREPASPLEIALHLRNAVPSAALVRHSRARAGGAGIDVHEAGVLTLNREYVYDGVRLDLDALFKLHPVLDEASALLEAIGPQVQEMQEMLVHAAAPDIAPSSHCFTPYACQYYENCTRNLAKPEHGLDELPRLTEERRTALEAEGIGEIRDIPESFPLTYLQRIVRRAVHEGRARLHSDVARALSMLVPPVRYLDFETFAPAIPRFAGTRPYEPIPFLFSVHTEDGRSQPRHEDYLHERDDDPRPPLAEHLIHALVCRQSPSHYTSDSDNDGLGNFSYSVHGHPRCSQIDRQRNVKISRDRAVYRSCPPAGSDSGGFAHSPEHNSATRIARYDRSWRRDTKCPGIRTIAPSPARGHPASNRSS